MPVETIAWTDRGTIRILDQRRLPDQEMYRDLETVEAVADAIETLSVRGAPLIGIAAAYGAALAARLGGRPAVEEALARLAATRPTAVNLGWALARVAGAARESGDGDLVERLLAEARAIHDEDGAMCRRIGEAGLDLIPDGATVVTHCNAGALATGGIGTALAPIYLAHEAGRRIHVAVPETRPLLQGARLTAWELDRAGVPCTLMTDGASASRLAGGDVAIVITGADRVAANGDVANKIGTLALALAAARYGVPFYVAFPASTFDPGAATGDAISIEQRAADEVRRYGPARVAAEVPVWNPAFDVTPGDLVAGYVTDRGLLSAAELTRLEVTG